MDEQAWLKMSAEILTDIKEWRQAHRYSPIKILLTNGQERNMRYWGEIENVDSQEGTNVIAATDLDRD